MILQDIMEYVKAEKVSIHGLSCNGVIEQMTQK